MTTINKESAEGELAVIGGITLLGMIAVAAVALGLWGCPQYSVYSARKEGEALLAHAQSSKEVAVAEAKAKMESAELLAESEIRRARGVAEANRIIGDSLKGNDAYLRYLWITGLESGPNRETVYIPTEAGLPVLEAGRFGKQRPIEQ
jgi:regulator of protease activity HflC (stomatin/prohibitin superfamily)